MPLLGSSYVVIIMLVLLHFRAAAPTAPVHAATGTFVYAGCSPSKYERNTAFENNLNSLLTTIASTASSGATYNSFTAGVGSGAADARAAAYGLYQCRGDLSPGECVACVQETVARLGAVCANSLAASLQADGCYVRYDASDFVGRADNTVAYRKCSSGTSEDVGFLKSRDGVLRQLQAQAAKGYNLTTSGTVQGVAQCLGDIAVTDCAACLAEAVVQLKGTCGSALAADVYLEQCYVKYWANGHDFHSSQVDCCKSGGYIAVPRRKSLTVLSSDFEEECCISLFSQMWSNDSDSDAVEIKDYSGDEFGRTVAIIVGILAGLALLVVFISFLTKAC